MRRWSSFSLVLVLVLAACAAPPSRATVLPPPSDVHATELAAIDTLAAQPAGAYVVTAYVVSSGACPACKGPDPCQPCGPPSMSVTAAPYVVGKPAQGPVVELATLGADAYDEGARYRFTVRVTPRERTSPYLELLGAVRLSGGPGGGSDAPAH